MTSQKRLSLPREHGAWLTLAGAVIGGMWLATDRWSAAGFALALLAAFVVRAPLERVRPARWDHAARVVCAITILAGALVAGWTQQWWGVAATACASGLVGASLLLRHTRKQRSAFFEAISMAALGASAGVIAWAGNAPLRESLVLGLVLGAHAAISVPLVRSDLRSRESPLRAKVVAVGGLGWTMIMLFLLGYAAAGVALLPRVLDLMIRHVTGWQLHSAALVGARETVELAAALALLLTIPL